MRNHLRILAINGEGISILSSTTLLNSISNSANLKITELFDMVIGTSFGSIAGAAYVVPANIGSTNLNDIKYTTDQVTDLITDNLQTIFPQSQARSGSDALRDGKYPRDGIDRVLQDNFNIDGRDILLSDTLIPLVVTSQNDVSSEPHIWYSCSETYGEYPLKNVLGASTATPDFFPPKYVPVQDAARANADNCRELKLERYEGRCADKNIDTSLYSNSPSSLSLIILEEILSGNTIGNCSKYNIVNNLSQVNVSTNSITVNDFSNPNTPSSLKIGNETDITVVSMGAARIIPFDDEVSKTDTPNFFLGVPIMLTLLTSCSCLAAVGTAIQGNRGSDTNNNAAMGFGSIVFAAYTVATSIIMGISWGSHSDANKLVENEDDLISTLSSGISVVQTRNASKILNTATDRDIFGTININPPVQNINNDDLDSTSVNTQNQVRLDMLDYYSNNGQSFNNLISCLSNAEFRNSDCDLASRFFFEESKSVSGENIINDNDNLLI